MLERPRFKQSRMLQDRQDDRAKSPGLQPPTVSMNFVERCFVAMTVAGFMGTIAVLIWIWLT
jgi:hypothetical protein